MAENRDSLLSACSALVNKGRWNEAIARLDQALQDSPGDLLVAFALANILNRKGDYRRAKELFNRIKVAVPDMAAVGLGLADSLRVRFETPAFRAKRLTMSITEAA